jgi:hypothetical protein
MEVWLVEFGEAVLIHCASSCRFGAWLSCHATPTFHKRLDALHLASLDEVGAAEKFRGSRFRVDKVSRMQIRGAVLVRAGIDLVACRVRQELDSGNNQFGGFEFQESSLTG